jgi:hypothetical protein
MHDIWMLDFRVTLSLGHAFSRAFGILQHDEDEKFQPSSATNMMQLCTRVISLPALFPGKQKSLQRVRETPALPVRDGMLPCLCSFFSPFDAFAIFGKSTGQKEGGAGLQGGFFSLKNRAPALF